MRKTLLLISLIMEIFMRVDAQECNVKGVVKYKYNDYVGYRIDEGAEIYVLSISKADSINAQMWEEYESIAKTYMQFLEYQNDEDLSELGIDFIRTYTGFSNESANKLNKLDTEIFDQYTYFVKNAEYIEVVDSSGKYSLKIPYGDYLILAKSKNRERPLLSELTGRILIEKVTVDKPTKIVSFDFCY